MRSNYIGIMKGVSDGCPFITLQETPLVTRMCERFPCKVKNALFCETANSGGSQSLRITGKIASKKHSICIVRREKISGQMTAYFFIHITLL